jgi:chitobiase/beta-hexosaminidase-like protein
MRIPLISSALALNAALVLGQDSALLAAQQANQQAMQSAQMANQQAMQAAQMANQQAMRVAQQTQTTAVPQGLVPGSVPRPRFSVKPGAFAAPLTVKIKGPRETTVYYTTDGWTPTKDSSRYTGPIRVDSTTTIQAIAVYDGLWRSIPASATYTVRAGNAVPAPAVATPASVSSIQAPPTPANRMLKEGTPVHLVFGSDVSSKTADVGDKIPMTLADDIKLGDVVLVKKGATAVATVTDADGKHILGVPGEIVFQADSLNVDGVQVKLRGGATKEASYRMGAAFSAMFVPVAGPFLVHGHDAEIKRGATFVASVSEDTPLPPKN